MRAELLQDAIGMIDDRFILEAKSINKKSNKNKIIKMWISAVAAVLVLAVVSSAVIAPVSVNVYAVTEAEYPERAEYPFISLDETEYKNAYSKWEKELSERTFQLATWDNLQTFFTESVQEFTADSDENIVCSPLSIYVALCVMAEISDGSSRQQILDLLQVESIEDLRMQVNSIWNYHYNDDGLVKSLLANSLWLDNSLTYNQNALKELAEIYYTSAYYGEMGSKKFNNKLQKWVKSQTNENWFDAETGKIKMTRESLLNLASTIYFSAGWLDVFYGENDTKGDFFVDDKKITAHYVNQSTYRSYYKTDNFTAVKQEMEEGYGMWLILPEDDTDADTLISDDNTMKFIMYDGITAECSNLQVNLSLPLFDVASQFDLNKGLQKLGVTDIFNEEKADFSPIIENPDGVTLSSVQQNIRYTICNDGEETEFFSTSDNYVPGDADEVDMTLDRPFIFAVTSDTGIPLFVGVVKQPI